MFSPKTLFEKLYKGDNKLNVLDHRYLPRWIILGIDLGICALSMLATYIILLKTPIKFHDVITPTEQGLIVIITNVFFFFIFKTYSGIIRHSTFTDIIKLAMSSFSTAVVILLFNYLYAVFSANGKLFLTTSILIYVLLSFALLLLFRVGVKEGYQFLRSASLGTFKKRVVIIGVDDQSISVGKAMTTESNLPFLLVGFISEGAESSRIKILGKQVFQVGDDYSETLSALDIDGVLIVSGSMSGKEKNKIVEHCLESNLEVFNVPSIEKWNKKEDIQNQIKPIDIQDLLDRSPISIDTEIIARDLAGKTILVTGGSGSIGSEIVKQLSVFSPDLVVILDQAESSLHELQLTLQQNYPGLNFITELADISNMYRIGLMFSKYKFDIVYHAAAYKHVPIIERNPHEAVYVNILGTINLALLSVNHKIEKFVMVSTDKAVNPTNVMGASKRVAEMYVQSLQNEKDVTTRFITTRFGNVLDSSGSVIPHFRKQISQGGPVTVTHKEIIRYFMTIPEACQLVLQAGTMGKGGEIYVFDMGDPVKILSLAERMIKLSGFEPYVDIDIKIIGLRPGEKLFEELLNDASTVLPTHHPKIMITEVPIVNFASLKEKTKNLIKVATKGTDANVVELLKEIVPEFISENSEFEILDPPESGKISG